MDMSHTDGIVTTPQNQLSFDHSEFTTVSLREVTSTHRDQKEPKAQRTAVFLTALLLLARRSSSYARELTLTALLLLTTRAVPTPQLHRLSLLRREDGEGVISTAIVVLIIAFLAVGMWVAFKTIMGTTTAGISNQVAQLGQ
jgi:hypothetical protein